MGVVGAGCATDDGAPDPTTDSREYALYAFETCDSLDEYLTDMATDLFVRNYGYGGYYGGPVRGGAEGDGTPPPMSDPTDAGGSPTNEAPQGPSEHTDTNTQEVGVDELDLMKTDGETVYYVLGNEVHIIDSWPAEEAREIASVVLEGYGESLFLAGDVLVAFTQISEGGYGCYYGPCPMPAEGGVREPTPVDGGAPMPADDEPGDVPPTEPTEPVEYEPPFNAVRATLIDVSDPANPAVLRTIDVEGYLVSGRMVDGIVYLASMKQADYYDPELSQALYELQLPDPWTVAPEDAEAVMEQVRAQVRPVIADYIANGGRESLLPNLRVDDGEQGELFACGDIYRSGQRSDLSLLSVVGFDPNGDATVNGAGLLANGWQVYGSTNALYVAQDSRWWYWPDAETRYAETHIHRFDLNGGEPVYVASGAVPGWIQNQFSMSEHEGTLRIATTDQTLGGWWWGAPTADVAEPAPVDGGGSTGGGTTTPVDGADDEPVTEPEPVEPEPVEPAEPPVDANNVFVLQLEEGELEIVGEVRGIAPGERIFATRFLGEKAYVVTFEQVDPLFVIDLADPTAPRVAGELHITGFSTYLHPIDENTLIGIGREGTETGQVLGLQIQVFDVSDPSNPTRVQQHVLDTPSSGWSYSEAEHDHHAFTWYASHNMLAIPVTLEDWSYDSAEYNYFSGIIVYNVSAGGISEVGRISHTGLVEEAHCSDEAIAANPDAVYECETWSYPWYAGMRRSAFIDEYLYAFSTAGVTASPLSDIDAPVATIPLF